MSNIKLKPPKALKKRLKAVASQHGFDGLDAVVRHFLERGVAQYETGPATGDLGDRLNVAVVEQGYSSIDELIEHLLLRGLRAYEDAPSDPAGLEKRLRGLGYIE